MKSPSHEISATETAGMWGIAAALAAVVCSAFTMVASLSLWAMFLATGTGEGPAFMAKLLLKGTFFAAVTAATAWALCRLTNSRSTSSSTGAPLVHGKWTPPILLAILLATLAAVLGARLDAFPWAAPDEMHHFVVARNLAQHGVYASGHPDRGFTYFDPYDSVGAPVIVPVAVALRAAGMRTDAGEASAPSMALGAGRAVLVVYYLFLCAVLFLLMLPVFGTGGAALGIVVMTASFGSTYLARTLYGEVPALAFLALGLLLWRYALAQPRGYAAALGAGIAFGLAVLCKSIMVLAAFPFLGVLLFDRLTMRRIELKHVMLPALTCALVVLGWWGVQLTQQYDVAAAAGGTVGMYKHNLMFGVRSAAHAMRWLLHEPLELAVLACGFAFAAPLLFRRRYDPPLMVLLLTGLFFAFWWVFFTPGQIPRYVWPAYAVGALGAGAMAWTALRGIMSRKPGIAYRAACAALVLLVAFPATSRASREIRWIYTLDEMADDHEVAFLLQDLPKSTAILTTYWPLERTLNFLAHRNVRVVEAIPDEIEAGMIVIVDEQTQTPLLAGHTPTVRIGRYAIVTRTR